MTDESTGRQIFFQADRLGLLWTFAEDSEAGCKYPGFGSLKTELLDAYGDFVEELESPPSVGTAECVYINHVEALSLADYLAGVLTNWKAPASVKSLGTGGRFSTHVHSPENPGLYWWIGARSSGDDPGFELRLDVRVDGDSLNADDAICQAHDHLIDEFYAWTSADMRAGWGEQ